MSSLTKMLCIVPLVAGCGSRGRHAQTELAAVRAEGKSLDAAVDRLEQRMLADQATVHLWQELARRHKQVSQVVAINHTEHWAGMNRYWDYQAVKAERLGVVGPRLAYSKRPLTRRKGSD